MKKLFAAALAVLAMGAYAHQYASMDELIADVCSVHAFDKCADPIVDTDGDGIPDDVDECPSDPTNTCNDPVDSDGDGVTDDVDQCPNTTAGAQVDAVGCEVVIPPPDGHLLTNAPVGQWIDIPNTSIFDVLPPESFESPIKYINGPRSIVGAWNGASWNEQDQQLHMIANGGHADYCGNEHPVFDADDLTVTLLVGPSSLGDKTYSELRDDGMTPDGRPVSRHSYNGTVFNSDNRKHYLFPGSSCDPAGDGDNKVWEIDNDTGAAVLVKDRDLPTVGDTGWRGTRNQAVYDPITKKIWVSNMGFFYSFDPVTYERKSFQTNQAQFPYGFKQGVAIDVQRRIMLLTGGGSFWTYHIDNNVLTKHTDKGADFNACYAPGVMFAQSLDKYIVSCDGATYYLIDPVTFDYTAHQTTGPNPEPPGTNGFYGKLQWTDKYHGIIAVDYPEGNIKFLKF